MGSKNSKVKGNNSQKTPAVEISSKNDEEKIEPEINIQTPKTEIKEIIKEPETVKEPENKPEIKVMEPKKESEMKEIEKIPKIQEEKNFVKEITEEKENEEKIEPMNVDIEEEYIVSFKFLKIS
jgi:hypothetical protein